MTCQTLTPTALMPPQIIAKGFKHFDTDGSNFIEAHEIERAVQKVLSVAHLPMVPPSILDGVFMKVGVWPVWSGWPCRH